MKQTSQGLAIAGAIGLASLIPSSLEAQLPFFTGQGTPTNYALENRTIMQEEDPEFVNISILKTFRNEIPFWAYVGRAYNNLDGFRDVFYGAGPMINIKNGLSMLATVEGSKEGFSGAALYSTLNLGKVWHVDFHPRLNKDFDYTSTSFNIGNTHKGFTFGVSSDITDGKLRDLKDTDLRIARVKKGSFIDLGFNPGKGSFRLSFQKAFW